LRYSSPITASAGSVLRTSRLAHIRPLQTGLTHCCCRDKKALILAASGAHRVTDAQTNDTRWALRDCGTRH
jgi:hypothetical protein